MVFRGMKFKFTEAIIPLTLQKNEKVGGLAELYIRANGLTNFPFLLSPKNLSILTN